MVAMPTMDAAAPDLEPSPAAAARGATPGADADTDAERRAMLAVRRLGHALTGWVVPGDLLAEVADLASRLAERAEAGIPRNKRAEMNERGRMAEFLRTGEWPGPLPDGSPIDFDHRSIIGGPLSPFGMGAVFWREGDEARCRVTLGPAFEGPPGRAHGGVIAAIVDEAMGALLPALGTLAFTGRLSVDYLRPAPLGVPLEFRSWLAGQEGRRLHIACEGSAEGVVFARAESTFVEQDPRRLVGPE
jgi:acyl-coenzyme A thioesterase PaaI-like protein